jgi:2-polyprenyl-3-methyl-5-hydroxy-6-metoxy-1,4-benzoquinol methylase
MGLEKQYDDWHSHAFAGDPDHADEESPWYRLVLEHLPPVNGLRILEIACGRGGFSRLLASQGAVMLGCDFSNKALQIAKQKHGNDARTHLDLVQADAGDLPFANESFDVVISCETIEHVPDPKRALIEMARVSRCAGRLFLTTPNYFNAMGLYYVYATLRGKRATPGSDQPYDRPFLFPRIRSLLKEAGWRILDSDGTVHQFPIRPGHSPVAVPALESNRSLRRLLSPLALHYFVIAGKNCTA